MPALEETSDEISETTTQTAVPESNGKVMQESGGAPGSPTVGSTEHGSRDDAADQAGEAEDGVSEQLASQQGDGEQQQQQQSEEEENPTLQELPVVNGSSAQTETLTEDEMTADNDMPNDPVEEVKSQEEETELEVNPSEITDTGQEQEAEQETTDDANGDRTTQEVEEPSMTRQPQTQQPRPAAQSTTQIIRSPRRRSIVSSIVIRQTEETLQALQASLAQSSMDLMRTLGNHLSQLPSSPSSNDNRRPGGGISLPASSIGWLAASRPPGTSLEPLLQRLTHLRIAPAQWPAAKPNAVNTASRSSRRNNSQSASASSCRQYYDSLQAFHRLRYNPTVDPSVFPNLQVLLLDKVPPDWIVRLASLGSTLQVLRVERASLYDLETFLLGTDNNSNEEEEGEGWEHVQLEFTELTHVKLSYCNLGETTRGLAPPSNTSESGSDGANHTACSRNLPLARMPKLQSLSLSHNEIRSERTVLASGISHATRLSILDLSHNQIPSLIHAPRYLGNLQTLILTGNRIQTSRGIDHLYGLKNLALDRNCISDWIHVAGLARLPELQVLKLKGNPCMETAAQQKHARVMLLDVFRDQRLSTDTTSNTATFRQLEAVLPVIDEKPVSERELKALQQRAFRIVAAPRTAAATTQRRDQPAALLGEANRSHQQPQSSGTITVTGAGGADDALQQPFSREEAKSETTRVAPAKVARKRRRKAPQAVITDEATISNSETTRLTARTQRSPTTPEPLVEDEKKEEPPRRAASSNDHDDKDQVTSLSPRLAFSIADVLLSLDDDTATIRDASKGDKGQLVQSEEGLNRAAAEQETNITTSNANGAATTPETADFEWPEPLPYCPKHNLYPEFEWQVQTTISLSEETKNRKPKSKKKKGKTGRSQQLNRKKPPAITTSGNAMDDALSKKQSKKKKKKSPASAPTSRKSSPSREAAEKQSGKTDGSRSASPKARTSPVGQTSQTKKKKSSPNRVATTGSDDNVTHKVKERSEPIDADTASAATTPTRSSKHDGEGRASLTPRRIVSSDDEEDEGDMTNPRGTQGASFPSSVMDDDATCSSLGTNRSGATKSLKGPNRQDKYYLAEVKSKFLGMEQERKLEVAGNLELYFKTFVFPDFVPNLDSDQVGADADTWQSVFFRYPRIQLLPKDRDIRDSKTRKGTSVSVPLQTNGIGENEREQFVKVWREDVVACGKPALRRLKPNRTAHFGFHGELSWLEGKVKTVSECRQVVLCLSSTSFYVILDNDSLTAKAKASTAQPSQANRQDSMELSPTKAKPKARKFPSPIPSDACFAQALWPHAIACHPLSDIQGITIGFGFQRMTIRIRNSAYPSAVDYTYTLLTSNKLKTVEILRELQGLVKDATLEMDRALTEDAIKIDNDDRVFLDALAKAVAPPTQIGPPEPVGAVLHYQILKQRWKHGQRGAVKRICVVTDRKIYLLDEEYLGDGSVSVSARSGERLGTPSFRLIDSADLRQVGEVKAADADPNATTIIIRPTDTFGRTHRWRLLCRDRSGAEKLVEDVRKGLALCE